MLPIHSQMCKPPRCNVYGFSDGEHRKKTQNQGSRKQENPFFILYIFLKKTHSFWYFQKKNK